MTETETLFITTSAGGTGKTAIAIALGALARDAGRSVGYMKPKGIRLRSRLGKVLDPDPLLASEVLDLDDPVEMMEPVVYSSSFISQVVAGRQDSAEITTEIDRQFQRLSEGKDLMLIEGANRMATGAAIDLTDPDLARRLNASVILVANYQRIEDVDDVLDGAGRFDKRSPHILFNAVTSEAHDELESEVIPFLESRGLDVAGIVPRAHELAAVEIGELANEIGAEVLTETPTDGTVERFSVGAMSDEGALRHFRRTRDAALITGGDRPGVQTAALEAPGIKCMILTGGYRPSGSIIGTAEERGVPILFVRTDTQTTIDRVESVLTEGRSRDPATIERMQSLLQEHVDLDALLPRDASEESPDDHDED